MGLPPPSPSSSSPAPIFFLFFFSSLSLSFFSFILHPRRTKAAFYVWALSIGQGYLWSLFKAIITLRAGGGELRARSEGGIRDKIRGVAGKFFNGRAPPADNDRRCFSAKFVKDKIFEGVAGEEGEKDERRHGGERK